MSALPRGICPVCGADVAVRRGGEVRQHDRWESFPGEAGLDGRRRATCPGTGQAERIPETKLDAATRRIGPHRWCETCEIWLSPESVTPAGVCILHQTPTETAEQVRRDRDALRADCARISAELDLPPKIGPAPGEIRRLRGCLRALCREAATRIGEQPATEAGHELYLRLRAAGGEP